MFRWIYGKNDNGVDETGLAFVTASDRMLTGLGLGIEYEGSRIRVAFYGVSRMVLVAGDLYFNSLALQALSEVEAQDTSTSTAQLSFRLGEIVGRLNADRAARKYLAPLGFSMSTIFTQEGGLTLSEVSNALTAGLISQIQAECADSAFIVAGCDERIGSLFHVDGQGIVTCHTDIGFLSIGSGGIHSSAYFMQKPYDHNVGFYQAIADTFFARKRAEISPGVGSITDMQYITGDGINFIPRGIINELQRSHRQYNLFVDRQMRSITNKITKHYASRFGAEIAS